MLPEGEDLNEWIAVNSKFLITFNLSDLQEGFAKIFFSMSFILQVCKGCNIIDYLQRNTKYLVVALVVEQRDLRRNNECFGVISGENGAE